MEEINWTQEQLLEVGLDEPDDFLKVERRYHALVWLPEKKGSCISPVTFYTSKVDTILCISKSYLRLMESRQTYQSMTCPVETQSQICYRIGAW